MGKHLNKGQYVRTRDQVFRGKQVIQNGLSEEGKKNFKMEMDQVLTSLTKAFILRATGVI